jgi:uncharacterized membrane protein YdcZ (DUF606 family)
MKLWRSVMKLPQPLKGCFVAFLVAFAVAFVSIPATAIVNQGKPGPVPVTLWSMGTLGVVVIVMGVVLAANLRGSAGAYASLIKDYKPMGIDYSRSFMANPKFARISGVLFVVVGIWFIVGSTVMASQMS